MHDRKEPQNPRLISWNITLRCPLRCAHCYINAGDRDAEDRLSTQEAYAVIDQIRELGTPVVILSGGEPLMREDIFAIARYGTEKGLKMAMGTSGVLIDGTVARDIREAGIRRVAISLDSADPAVHDTFRGLPGAWDQAVQGIRCCSHNGVGVQINMTVLSPDFNAITGVVALGTGLGVTDYQLFFPVPTGRASSVPWLTPQVYEDLIGRVLVTYQGSEVSIRPTCAPQFRRIAATLGISNPAWGRGCIAGTGYCRIFVNGDVTPCPYLPARAGNVREIPLKTIWNESPVFCVLRDPTLFTGKCARCEYGDICGGCRARSAPARGAMTDICGGIAVPDNPAGELCGEDPWCPYIPAPEHADAIVPLDKVDRALLEVLQDSIPLVPRPFLALAQRIGISEQELLARAQRLQNEGVVRNISPVLESRHLGLNAATLIALRVPEARIQEVAAVISSYPQVSHNFLRDHEYALWFTLSGKHAGEIDHVLKDILRSTGIPASDLLNLPTVQQRKVDVRFSFLNDEERRDLRGSA